MKISSDISHTVVATLNFTPNAGYRYLLLTFVRSKSCGDCTISFPDIKVLTMHFALFSQKMKGVTGLYDFKPCCLHLAGIRKRVNL